MGADAVVPSNVSQSILHSTRIFPKRTQEANACNRLVACPLISECTEPCKFLTVMPVKPKIDGEESESASAAKDIFRCSYRKSRPPFSATFASADR